MRALLALVAAIALLATTPMHAAPVTRGEEKLVLSRVMNRVSPELAQYFDTVLYVSKAPSGPLAQHMFVLEKDGYGGFQAVEKFAVSTGRERKERYFTATPVGVFQLDRTRMFAMHHSKTWDNAPMPYAMFLDVSYRSRATGIALHAAYGKAGARALGRRASGGCVRLPAPKAKALFNDIRYGRYDGMVPEFVFDSAAGVTSPTGEIARDAAGRPRLKRGIAILLVIENFSGKGRVAQNGIIHATGAG
jgi:hypothetical protein